MSFKQQLQQYKNSTLKSLKSSWQTNPTYSNKRKAFGGLDFQPHSIKCSYKGISFDSRAEAVFYIYEKEVLHSNIVRNKTKFLLYRDPVGQIFKFYPDFLKNGTFIEVKGIVSSLDMCKRDQHPEVVWVVVSEQEFLFKKMEETLDRLLPNWRKDIL